ncbi:hypothetical protein RKE25_23265 (plasmid) [Dyella sp. BiH032]|uniref:hypothetical protein n=1 Tax=Dyella sp. BiH032 TaxID=3075430 RepID=UPI002892E26A|nr:hypothetical protein [Dyella sp. BiH032]WNL48536.1 hypothetical protein RKE25_23265 [Dyella sp. BiH032]
MMTIERKLSPSGLEKFMQHIQAFGDPFRDFASHYADFQNVIDEQACRHEMGGPPPWYYRPCPYYDEEGQSQAYYVEDFLNL